MEYTFTFFHIHFKYSYEKDEIQMELHFKSEENTCRSQIKVESCKYVF